VAKTLTEIALDERLVDPAALREVAAHADTADEPLVVSLIRVGGVGEVALVAAIHRQLRVTVIDPAAVALDTDALRELPRSLCERRRVLPLALTVPAEGPSTLRLAMADPTDQVALAEVEHVTGHEIEPVLMTLPAVEELIDRGYRGIVTQVMPRQRSPAPTARVVAQPAPPTTTPHHRVADEATAQDRHEALVRLLIDRGVISAEDYEAAIRDRLERSLEDT